jgi:hypothetical protein
VVGSRSGLFRGVLTATCVLMHTALVAQPSVRPSLHVLGRVASDTDYVGLTRDRMGRIYISGAPGGLVRFAANGGDGTRLKGREGRPLSGGDFAWLGDTLAFGGYQGWSLLREGADFVGCRGFEDAHNEFATQVFRLRPLRGGFTLGELTPAYPGEIQRFLVVSRDQQILTPLAAKPPEPPEVEIDLPRRGTAIIGLPERTEPLWSAADNDSGVVVVDQTLAEGKVHVRRLDFWGRLRAEWTLTLPLLGTSRAWREREIAEWAEVEMDGSSRADSGAVAAALRRGLPLPPYHPPVTMLVTGSDGTPWLRLASESDTVVWARLGPHGRQHWVLPADFKVLFADADGLWGVRPRGHESEVVTTAALPAGWQPLRFPPPPPPGPVVLGDHCS